MPITTAKNITLMYGNEVWFGEEFDIKLKLIGFKADNYDVKIDIFGGGKRISRIFDNFWKSTNYYVNDAIDENSEKKFILNISENYDGDAEMIIKIRDSKGKVDTFSGYVINILPKETEESEEEKNDDVEIKKEEASAIDLNPESKIAQINDNEEQVYKIALQKPIGKGIKSQKNKETLVYKSTTAYMKDYILYIFALFCLIVLFGCLIKLTRRI